MISHNPKLPPHKARTRISFIKNETSKENVILLDGDDTDEEINPSDGTEKQLSSAISSASTRAEVAALAALAPLATLIPPVSPAGAFLTILPGQVADSDSVFTNPFSIVQRPCRAVIERAETLLIDERDEGKDGLGVVIPGLGKFYKQGLRILKKYCNILKQSKR